MFRFSSKIKILNCQKEYIIRIKLISQNFSQFALQIDQENQRVVPDYFQPAQPEEREIINEEQKQQFKLICQPFKAFKIIINSKEHNDQGNEILLLFHQSPYIATIQSGGVQIKDFDFDSEMIIYDGYYDSNNNQLTLATNQQIYIIDLSENYKQQIKMAQKDYKYNICDYFDYRIIKENNYVGIGDFDQNQQIILQFQNDKITKSQVIPGFVFDFNVINDDKIIVSYLHEQNNQTNNCIEIFDFEDKNMEQQQQQTQQFTLIQSPQPQPKLQEQQQQKDGKIEIFKSDQELVLPIKINNNIYCIDKQSQSLIKIPINKNKPKVYQIQNNVELELPQMIQDIYYQYLDRKHIYYILFNFIYIQIIIKDDQQGKENVQIEDVKKISNIGQSEYICFIRDQQQDLKIIEKNTYDSDQNQQYYLIR